MNERSTDNEILSALLSAHGFTCAEYDVGVVVDNKPPLLNATIFRHQDNGNSKLVQLDVKANFTPDCVINESFAGFGASYGEARKNAFENFIANSFHVFVGAFFDPDDEEVTHEKWLINNQEWRVVIGNFGLRGPNDVTITLPENLLETFEGLIQSLPLSTDIHWFRFYYMRYSNGKSTCEVLKDNETWEDAISVMEHLPWSDTDTYYSVRLFMILQKSTT